MSHTIDNHTMAKLIVRAKRAGVIAESYKDHRAAPKWLQRELAAIAADLAAMHAALCAIERRSPIADREYTLAASEV